jgi:hypothetical protein
MFTAGLISAVSLAVGRFGEQHLGWELIGWWWVLTVWIFALGISYLARFLQGRWKTMRVIEPEMELEAEAKQEELVLG